MADGAPFHGGLFTERNVELVRPGPDERLYACHFTIWSGSLYRLAAVAEIGPPDEDWVLDWGEFEYGYRAMRAGYEGFIDRDAVLQHNVRGAPSLVPVDLRFGPVGATFHEFPPIRCYYMCRNMLHFALHTVERRQPALSFAVARRVLRLTVNFLLRPFGHGAQIRACLRGIRDGLAGNIRARF